MQERNESGLPASLANGRLEGVSVPDLLWNLCRRRSTGVLHLTAQGITKKVYIEEGRIVFALSGDPDDRLAGLLLREELITVDQLELGLARLSSGRRFGGVLVDAGVLSPEHLVKGVLSQVKGVVLALFLWEEGEYAFVEGPLPTAEVIKLGMRTGEILLQGIRQVRSFARIRKSVGAPSVRFRLDPAWHDYLDGLEIRDGERMLLQRLDEAGAKGVSIEAMCKDVFLSNFEIYQALWAFLVLGVVREVDRMIEPVSGSATEGRIEGGSFPEVLVRLCRDEVSGALHLTKGTLERTIHIKAGQCVFATSNALDDGLVAHLLRRGVISLSDRDETARRLLSNKRVGAILLEMGVIDESDLRIMVRDQLSEIIFDTFRWDRGEFQFVAGELPTVEEITLTRTTEELVLAGVRRVTSWSRVQNGCGGLGARLTLLPEYLSILDKMTVGPEEWELISLLKTPKSVREICRESVLGDFRSCQILWALRLLGGIGEAPVEVSIDTALDRFEPPPVAEPRFEDAFQHHDVAPQSEPEPAPELDPEPEPEPQLAQEPDPEPEPQFVREPDPEPEPIPLSEADSTAEVVSEPWRLAAGRTMEPPTAADANAFQFDSPADATVAIPREDLEAALRGPDDHPPRFELGEPGTGPDDMKVDMPPAAPAMPAALAVPTAPTPEATHAVVSSDDDRPAESWDEPAPASAADALVSTTPDWTEDFEPGTPEPVFELPANLDHTIARFNARHVILFRTLRSEIGAGAANFVRSCRTGLESEFAQLLGAADLRADGSWDPDALRRSVIEFRVANVDECFRKLLDAEMIRLRAHLGDARAGSLAAQLSAVT